MAQSAPSELGPDAKDPIFDPNTFQAPATILDWELPPFLFPPLLYQGYDVASASPVPSAVIKVQSYPIERFCQYVNETVGRLSPQRLKAYPEFLPVTRKSSNLPVTDVGCHPHVHFYLSHPAGSHTPVSTIYPVPLYKNKIPLFIPTHPAHLSSFRENFKSLILPTTDYVLRALRAGQALRQIDPLDLDLPHDEANLDHLKQVRVEEENYQRAYLWQSVAIEENTESPAAEQLFAWRFGPSGYGPQIEFQGKALMVACPPWTMNEAEFLKLTQARTLDVKEEDYDGLGLATSTDSTASTVILNKIALCCGRNQANYFIFTNGTLWTFGRLSHGLEGTVTITMSSPLPYNTKLRVEDPVPYVWPESKKGVFKPKARGARLFAVICCWLHEAMTSEMAATPVAPPPPPAQRQKVEKSSAQSRSSGQSSTPTALSPPPGLTKSRANVPSGASSTTHSASNAIAGPSTKGPGKRSFTEAIGNNEDELDGTPKKILKLSVDEEAAVGRSLDGKEQAVVASINTEAGPSKSTGPKRRTVKPKKEQEIVSLPLPDLSQMVPTISPAAVPAATRPNTRKAAQAAKAEIESDHVVPRRSARVQIRDKKKAEVVSPLMPTPKQAKKVAKKASTGVTKEKAVRGKRVKLEPAPSGDDDAAPAPSPLIRKSAYRPVLKRGRSDEDEGEADEDGTSSKRARTDAGPSRALLHRCQYTTPSPPPPPPSPSPAPPPPAIENDTMEVDDASLSTLLPAIAMVDNAMDVDEPELPPPDVQVPSRHARDRRQLDRLTPTFAVAKRKGAAAAGRARRKPRQADENLTAGPLCRVELFGLFPVEPASLFIGRRFLENTAVGFYAGWNASDSSQWTQLRSFGGTLRIPPSGVNIASYRRRFMENTTTGIYVGWNASDSPQWTKPRSIISSRSSAHVLARELLLLHFPFYPLQAFFSSLQWRKLTSPISPSNVAHSRQH